MSQYQAPTPLLYDQTSTAFTYGLPRDANTVSTLADGDVDVSHLEFEYSSQSAQEEFDAFEGYGVQTHEAAFGSHEDEEMEIEMEMDIRINVIGQSMRGVDKRCCLVDDPLLAYQRRRTVLHVSFPVGLSLLQVRRFVECWFPSLRLTRINITGQTQPYLSFKSAGCRIRT